MKEDFWRFTGVVLVSLLAGVITGHTALWLLAGLALIVIWHYRVFRQLLLWLQRPEESRPPELAGLVDEICREVDFLMSHHKHREEKLSAMLRRFQEATAALPDAVIILGEYGVIEWANEKARDYLGIRWPQDGRQRITNLIRHPDLVAFISGRQPGEAAGSLQLDSPVSADMKLEFRITPYGGKQKLLVASDISSVIHANQVRKDFIANASHELWTPLTVIAGYLEAFSSDGETCPESWEPQIRQMRRQTERMQRLIGDLLKLSSLEIGTDPGPAETVPVPDLLNGIYLEAQTLSGIMEHIFYLESDTTLWLRGNPGDLYSAFSNIVFNAVQHTPERGVIRIRWYADGNGAHLEVRDNGEGIAPEHIPRLTERFYRVDKGRSREKGGTGLGLAIVKHVMARHGGSLHIESTVGKGSTFRCNFPEKKIITRENDSSKSLSA